MPPDTDREPLERRALEISAPYRLGEVVLNQAGTAAAWLETDRSGRRRIKVLFAPSLPGERLERSPLTDVAPASRLAALDPFILYDGPADGTGGRILRTALPHLSPVPFGLEPSFGFGDRLGSATPGHITALQRTGTVAIFAPVFAQQSVRENSRTGRTPAQVLDDATFGALQAGWAGPVGADADHVKTPENIESFAEAGYSMFTFDVGDHVPAQGAATNALEAALQVVPWSELHDDWAGLRQRFTRFNLEVDGAPLKFDDATLAGAAVKYGAAVAHAARLNRALLSTGIACEVEISVDETATPTTWQEHAYVALELRRLGVSFVSLAPRFVGRFEKGVEFRGDLAALERSLRGHADLARQLGPYKLSLHSGSDKFSVYPLLAAATNGVFHVKTAGTSYLEALRVVASADPALFRSVLKLALARFTEESRTYHVSADVARVPTGLSDAELPELLDQDDARQVLHVTFGSVLQRFGDDIKALLETNATAYREGLARHFGRHLSPAWYIVPRAGSGTPHRAGSP